MKQWQFQQNTDISFFFSSKESGNYTGPQSLMQQYAMKDWKRTFFFLKKSNVNIYENPYIAAVYR